MRNAVTCSVALMVVVIAAGVLLGCGGDDVPGDAAAVVDGTVITKADVHHWRSFYGGAPGEPGARRRTLSILIQREWLLREAEQRGLATDLDAYRRTLERSLKAEGGSSLQALIGGSPLSEEDYLNSRRAREQLTRFVGDPAQVSERDVERYYRAHRRLYQAPAQRYVRAVVTKTRTDALAARRALASRASWRVVTRRWSVEEQPKDQLVLDENKGEDALLRVAFSTPIGRLAGPVQTQFGWYVVEVTSVGLGARPIENAKEMVRTLLRMRQINRIRNQLVGEHRPETSCAPDYKVPQCSNDER